MTDELRDKMLENASGPKRVVGDQIDVTQHSLKEQMEIDQYLRDTAATARRKLPIRKAKIIPGGTV